jgi:hypothetical protein
MLDTGENGYKTRKMGEKSRHLSTIASLTLQCKFSSISEEIIWGENSFASAFW